MIKDSIKFLNRLGGKIKWDSDGVEELQVIRTELENVQRDSGLP
jgi:hypothetical protein